jgi:hypothetical protein
MNDREPAGGECLAGRYVKSSFEDGDRLAIVLMNKRTSAVIQRLATARTIASEDFQDWLRHQNAQKFEVYISMNALKSDARGRTKADVAEIRHIYLDFDQNGTEAVRELSKRQDLPAPSFVLNTSPDKWQVTWRVGGFAKDQAEQLQRALARETGADPAATDCSRVLRLPGFYNHKYSRPHLVRVEPDPALPSEIYRPEHFPEFSVEERSGHHPMDPSGSGRRTLSSGHLSQSERDWAYAKRALARGDAAEMVISAIACHRRFDKHNSQYYAELTVRKAVAALKMDRMEAQRGGEPER